MNKNCLLWSAVALVSCTLASLGQAQGALQLIANGGFEAGLDGWTVFNQEGGSGAFYAANAAATPMSGLPAAGPSSGLYYAISDQLGPGAHALLQSFTIPVGSPTATLAFDMFVDDHNMVVAPVVSPVGLDYRVFANQHARLDILRAAAAPLSTASADVVANFYLGIDAGPSPHAYTAYGFDLLGAGLTPGTGYQLRFAEVDNQGFFNQGIDNVSILAGAGHTPEPTSLLIWSATLVLAAAAYRRRRRTSIARASSTLRLTRKA